MLTFPMLFYFLRFFCDPSHNELQTTGKTSLLHALSGKTFNGSVTGKIMVNGHKTSLETHGNVVGFVPEVGLLLNECLLAVKTFESKISHFFATIEFAGRCNVQRADCERTSNL